MTTETDKFLKLMARCKCGVYLIVNAHRDCYISAAEQLADWEQSKSPPDISDAAHKGILDSGNIVDLQFYPNTPIGYERVIHFDLNAALDLALLLTPEVA